MDVVGLCPHIPHSEGLEALRLALNKAEGNIPVDDLVSHAKLVLENNFFEFVENVFRQKLGAAIGTKFALGFANIFTGYFEERFLDSCELKTWVWSRFLDAVFMIWLHGGDELSNFLAK